MLLNALNVIYVLIAIAMVAFILLQRGAGATAGASFGAGASATVFGSRGASSFLTRTTAVLATSFFILSLGMGVYVSRGAGIARSVDLGVMGATSDVPQAPGVGTPAAPAPAKGVPAAPPAVKVPANGVPTATPVAKVPAGTLSAPIAANKVPAAPDAETKDQPTR